MSTSGKCAQQVLISSSDLSAQSSRDHCRRWLPELTLWSEALALVEVVVVVELALVEVELVVEVEDEAMLLLLLA